MDFKLIFFCEITNFFTFGIDNRLWMFFREISDGAYLTIFLFFNYFSSGSTHPYRPPLISCR